MELKEYAEENYKKHMPEGIKATTGCFENLGGGKVKA